MSRQETGFTIVETIIVLAAAGLILLLVLLAIPNLQRNGRNNQRNQDAQTILQAVSHYELNHAGNVPSQSQLRNFINSYEKDQLTYYSLTGISVNLTSPSNGIQNYPSAAVGLDSIQIVNHAKCVAGGTATNQGAGYSDVVALYSIETAHGKSSHCQQL